MNTPVGAANAGLVLHGALVNAMIASGAIAYHQQLALYAAILSSMAAFLCFDVQQAYFYAPREMDAEMSLARRATLVALVAISWLATVAGFILLLR